MQHAEYESFSRFVGVDAKRQKWSFCPFEVDEAETADAIEWVSSFISVKAKWRGPGNEFFALMRTVYVLAACLAMIAGLALLFIADVVRNFCLSDEYAKFE